MSIYDYQVKDGKDRIISLKEYEGKVLLIVNTATGCGFTPQYEGLQRLYDKYKDQGFVVLDFPCNQFGHQAPGTNQEIAGFCQLRYGTTFPTFAKLEVNGENEAPLYGFLKKQQRGIMGNNIKWNFTKFLVDKDGNVTARYSPVTTPEQIEESIIKLLPGK